MVLRVGFRDSRSKLVLTVWFVSKDLVPSSVKVDL